MNITIEQLMATIGRLHVQVDLLSAENATLKNRVASLAPKQSETPALAPASKE